MPELPEVETIRRDLSSALLRRTVQSIQVKDPFVLTGIGPNGKPRRRVKTAEFEKQILDQGAVELESVYRSDGKKAFQVYKLYNTLE